MSNPIEILRLFDDAIMPSRAHPTDAGLDLVSRDSFEIEPGFSKVVSTGIALKLPKDTVGVISDRSSLAKKGLKTAGGIIDQDYRGEIKVVVWNISKQPIQINKRDRIAQLLILPVYISGLIEVKTLDSTQRSDKGFGSSGK